MIAIKKLSSKLKVWSVEMPNAPYSKRWQQAEITHMETKSIEQLEKDIWKNLSEFPTDLVEKCYHYRKISIAELTNEQIRLLISQKIGIEYLIGIALEKLERNILTECDFYEGDLLIAVSSLPTEFWNENQTEFLKFKNIVEQNSEIIKNELGEKKFDRINKKLA
ncbi:contact-dependent growth inhibition system immunity protein [Hyunsoonleella aquatilis]|nr:contact-dependent growth inhibition system immunity protein [Hyunsoonleella aquatilis]